MAISALPDRAGARSSGAASLAAARPAPDTAPAAGGVTRRVLLSILETFFRRPILYLLPLALLIVLGIASGFNSPKQYRSVGTLDSSSGTVLADIAGSNRSFGFESAAAATSRNLNQRLRTGEFVNMIIDEAGLRTAVNRGLLTADDVRGAISAYPEGDNLLSVSATTSDPEQSRRLAQGTIDVYLDFVISNDNADRLVAIDTYRTQLEAREAELREAEQAHRDYLEDHPIADEDDREFEERLEIQRLERDVEQATGAFQEAEDRLRDAELNADVAETVIKRQLRPVDAPESPVAPQARLRKAVMTVALFTAVGAVLSLVFLVLSAFLDRTIRESSDVTDRFGLDVIAVIPAVSKRSRKR